MEGASRTSSTSYSTRRNSCLGLAVAPALETLVLPHQTVRMAARLLRHQLPRRGHDATHVPVRTLPSGRLLPWPVLSLAVSPGGLLSSGARMTTTPPPSQPTVPLAVSTNNKGSRCTLTLRPTTACWANTRLMSGLRPAKTPSSRHTLSTHPKPPPSVHRPPVVADPCLSDRAKASRRFEQWIGKGEPLNDPACSRTTKHIRRRRWCRFSLVSYIISLCFSMFLSVWAT